MRIRKLGSSGAGRYARSRIAIGSKGGTTPGAMSETAKLSFAPSRVCAGASSEPVRKNVPAMGSPSPAVATNEVKLKFVMDEFRGTRVEA